MIRRLDERNAFRFTNEQRNLIVENANNASPVLKICWPNFRRISSTFILEIIASQGRMEVILNDSESVIYESAHIGKWGVFENYFKTGNYLVSRNEGAFSRMKYYELEVTHE